jgi:hypothetical protein
MASLMISGLLKKDGVMRYATNFYLLTKGRKLIKHAVVVPFTKVPLSSLDEL